MIQLLFPNSPEFNIDEWTPH